MQTSCPYDVGSSILWLTTACDLKSSKSSILGRRVLRSSAAVRQRCETFCYFSKVICVNLYPREALSPSFNENWFLGIILRFSFGSSMRMTVQKWFAIIFLVIWRFFFSTTLSNNLRNIIWWRYIGTVYTRPNKMKNINSAESRNALCTSYNMQIVENMRLR